MNGAIQANDRVLGYFTVAAAALTILAMAHHPQGLGPSGLAETVHGALMVLVIVACAGVLRFSSRLGCSRSAPLLGLVFYVAGTFANLLAATLNGFVAPALAREDLRADYFPLIWEFNQALANLAVFAFSIAIALFGAELLRRGGGFQRITGAICLLAGLAPVALLTVGFVEMNVPGAFLIYGIQALFTFIVGVSLLRKQ